MSSPGGARADCFGHGADHVVAGCASCDEDGLDGLEEGLACQPGISGHQCGGRRRAGRRSCDGGLAFASPRVAVQAIRTSSRHHRVFEGRLRQHDEGVHLKGPAPLGERRLGGGDAAHSRPFRGRAEFSRAAQEGHGGAVASSLTGTLRAPLQDDGDFLVPADRCRRQVPRPPVTVVLRVGGRGERLCAARPSASSAPRIPRSG